VEIEVVKRKELNGLERQMQPSSREPRPKSKPLFGGFAPPAFEMPKNPFEGVVVPTQGGQGAESEPAAAAPPKMSLEERIMAEEARKKAEKKGGGGGRGWPFG